MPEENVILDDGKRELEEEGRGLRNLNADVLAEVFSYLPQRELFEVMSVSRQWEEAVMGGPNLWRKVDVLRKGCISLLYTTKAGMNNEVNGMLSKIIGAAHEIKFSRYFRDDQKFVRWAGGYFGP